MPFDPPLPSTRRRIAVIGAGISGLGAARALASDHEVTIFESRNRLGGHACTVMAGNTRNVPTDMGFIVYNDKNYPNLRLLFEELNTPTKPSNMSFSASFDGGNYEYGLRLSALLSQKQNLIRPSFYKMVQDILKFNKRAHLALDRSDVTLDEFLSEIGTSTIFRERYLLPFAGAIWSASPAEILEFPAATLCRFFQNHGLLASSGQPEWRTVDGGSQVYVSQLEDLIKKQGVTIRKNAKIETVKGGSSPTVKPIGLPSEEFDAVILSCHSDQALKLIIDAPIKLTSALGDIHYSANTVVMHNDHSFMPKRKGCWSSWNYLGRLGKDPKKIGVTYWMNNLQDLPTSENIFVTLNPDRTIEDCNVFACTEFSHPQFDQGAILAQNTLKNMQGDGGLWFAGAYHRYGFHEDGLLSGLEAAKSVVAALA